MNLSYIIWLIEIIFVPPNRGGPIFVRNCEKTREERRKGGGGGGEKKRRRLKWKKIGFKTSIGRDGISLPTGYFVSPDITTDLTAARVCFCGEEIGWPERRNTCRRGNVKYRVHGSKKISFFFSCLWRKGKKDGEDRRKLEIWQVFLSHLNRIENTIVARLYHYLIFFFFIFDISFNRCVSCHVDLRQEELESFIEQKRMILNIIKNVSWLNPT